MSYHFTEITIKKNKGITKFKLRTPKCLLTLKLDSQEKADRIIQAIPPSKPSRILMLDLTKIVIEKKKKKNKKA